ncbi:MAG: leucine-rich repeat domain-containing protein, partial [Oscillospiraceae bacterium]|nr:leucine-rich repeat domain-containing protein [Oscillospiraceae bacterium]
MKRSVFSMLLCVLCVAMVVLYAPTVLGAREAVAVLSSGTFTYTTDGSGNATITGYSGTDTNLVIPDTIDGYPVTTIGNDAFKNNDALTGVTLPSGLTYIGTNAFCNCDSLTSITIPKTLESVGNRNGDGGPFNSCDNLTTAVLEDGMTTVPGYLFR